MTQPLTLRQRRRLRELSQQLASVRRQRRRQAQQQASVALADGGAAIEITLSLHASPQEPGSGWAQPRAN